MEHAPQPEALWSIIRHTPAIRQLVSELREAVGAEGSSLLLLDKSEMFFALAEGLNAADLEGAGAYDQCLRIPISLERGINPIAALMGKTICLQEMDGRHNRTVDEKLRQTTHSMVAVPIVAAETVVGTLSMINAHADADEATRYRVAAADIRMAENAAAAVGRLLDGGLGGNPA